jgi:hypothetical protein
VFERRRDCVDGDSVSNWQARAKSGKIGQKCGVGGACTSWPEKVFASACRNEGCPDTLIKDVRDVAAAVFATPSSAKSALAGDPEQTYSEGAGTVVRKIESTEIPGHLSLSR